MRFFNKTIYLAALAALAVPVTGCDNEEDPIFDQTAAERLELYKTEYANTLAADGGKWAMEYFCNSDEPGYVMITTFNADGSVTVSANTKWHRSFKSETSLWQMISDNGPVLTFNSYNSVLHLFSDPDNITGSDAPTNPDTGDDIDETGYGHKGDYEFQVMAIEDDGQTMRLLGKKTGYTIYLRRLPADTDDATYLAEMRDASEHSFSNAYPDFIITETATGERFVVHMKSAGIFNIWPEAGDAVTQTITANALVTPTSVRFMQPIEVQRANGTETITLHSFVKQDDGTYKSEEADSEFIMDGNGLGTIFTLKNYKWRIDLKEAGGAFATDLAAIATETKSEINRTFQSLEFFYYANEATYAIHFRNSGSAAAAYVYGDEQPTDDGLSVRFNISTTEGNTNGVNRLKQIPTFKAFIERLNATDFRLETETRFAPATIKFVDSANESNYFVVNRQR